jgi:hypothetical protein
VCLYSSSDKVGRDTEVRLGIECLYLGFSFGNQAYSHRLHAACRQRRFDFFPQHWRKLKPDNTVQNTTGLLGIYAV